MIVRRPGTWGTMSGEAMEDDRTTEAIGMAGLQQQVKSLESSRSGCSSGWGTCAELLLVSAVKKHGVPNWNLVSLELKSRAVVLNSPPSCFSEEACKFKYNALKGKFASSSSSSVSLDDDLNGVSWFEELRKLRMSHLKEELQVYDSSIGQLQSRISRLKEERAQGLLVQSVMKPYESICAVDPYSKGCKTSDLNAHTPTRLSCDPLEKPQQSPLKRVAQADLPAGNVASGGLDYVLGSGNLSEGHEFHRNSPTASAPNRTTIVDSDEVETGVDFTVKKRACSVSVRMDEEVAGKVEDQFRKNGEHEAFRVSGDKIVEQEIDRKGWDTYWNQSTRGETSGTSLSAGGEENPRGNSLANTTDASIDELKHQVRSSGNVGLQTSELGKHLEADLVSTFGRVSGSTVDVREGRLLMDSDPSAALVVNIEMPHRDPEAEVSYSRGRKVETILKKEPRLSKLSLSFGRAEKDRRLKALEEGQLQRTTGLEVGDILDGKSLQRTGEAAEKLGLEGRDFDDNSLLIEETERGRMPSRDPASFASMETGAVGEDIVSILDFRDGNHRVLESSLQNDEKRVIDNYHSPSGVDVIQPRHGPMVGKGAESCSLGCDLPPLSTRLVAQGPEKDHLALEQSICVASMNSSGKPNVEIEGEVSHADPSEHDPAIESEMPLGMTAASSLTDMIVAVVEEKKEEVEEEWQVTGDVRMDGEMLKSEQEAVLKLESADEVDEFAEEQRLDTDLGACGSLGDNVSETLDLQGMGSLQEESKDCPDVGEVQQPFPDYTDSQIDKSEVGSSMDSIEDMSPSSRKIRREPKVPGKLLPLLECLRVICAHKFAPLFRQRQEYQDNAEYDRLVRRHVDLTMVRSRLEEGAYSGSVEFFRDLLLIFTNALVYNNSESQEYVGAKALRSCALTEMDKILQTEALLKQNGPATRKREVRKTMDVHRMRLSSTPASEARRKGILKGNNESATLDLQGGARSSHLGFEDTPLAGRSSNNNQEDRELDGRIDTSKKLIPNHVKEETTWKELQKPALLVESKRKDSRKPELSEGKRKESKKPELSGGKRRETQKPESLSESKRKEPQKPDPVSEGNGKESQKPELNVGKQKQSQKPELLSGTKRKELKKPEALTDSRRQKPELLIEGNKSGAPSISGKKVKVDAASQKDGSQGQAMADLKVSGERLNVENLGIKTVPTKMKDVMCIDVDKKGSHISSSVVPSGLPLGKQQTPSILRQTSTSRVSRNSKRGGDSSASNWKKRARK